MNPKSLAFALLAGFASFLMIAVAVTALLEPRIEFSALLGLPAGLVAGALATGSVYLGLADDTQSQRRRVAYAFGAFGAGYVAAFAIAVIAGTPLTLSMGVAVLGGLLVAVAGYLRGPKTPPAAAV